MNISTQENSGSPLLPGSKRAKTILISLELILVISLLALWIGSESIRNSKNLWVLFFYSFPCQFAIALVPHEPVFLYFSKFHTPLLVTMVSLIGTTITEILNYYFISAFNETKLVQKVIKSGFVKRLISLYNRAPMTALLIAGFSPVPFYPFRFLVVFANYPVTKYALAVFISRGVRFYLMALFGAALDIPNYILFTLFFILAIILYIPFIRSFRKPRFEPASE